MLGYIIYDDACHLKKFATNKTRSTQTETSQRIASMKMVVDRFHFPGHVDTWCKKNCNPNDCDELEGVRKLNDHVHMCVAKGFLYSTIICNTPGEVLII